MFCIILLVKGGMNLAIQNYDVNNVYDGLIHNFLYKNDINCIHILLNLYDLEENITNISPRYMTINNLKKQISKILINKKENQFISSNIGQLIHDDINRLELFIYLEGYKQGYFNNYWVNIIENVTVKKIHIDKLYRCKYLFHFDNKLEQISNIRSSINDEIQNKEIDSKFLSNIINKYCNNILKSKILNINNSLDKQLVINYNSRKFSIGEGDTILTLEEIDNIYREILKIILESGLKLYKEAYWYGLNDRVLKRYR